MKNVGDAVKKETLYVASWVVVFSAVMQGVFLILNFFKIASWDYTAILGNLLGGVFSVLYFFLMALTIQKAVEKDPEKVSTGVRISQMLRNLMVGVVILVGVFVPFFNVWTVALPFLFPKIALMIRSSVLKKRNDV